MNNAGTTLYRLDDNTVCADFGEATAHNRFSCRACGDRCVCIPLTLARRTEFEARRMAGINLVRARDALKGGRQ